MKKKRIQIEWNATRNMLKRHKNESTSNILLKGGLRDDKKWMSKTGFASCSTYILFCFGNFFFLSILLLSFILDVRVYMLWNRFGFDIMSVRCLHNHCNAWRLIHDNIQNRWNVLFLCVYERTSEIAWAGIRNMYWIYAEKEGKKSVPCGDVLKFWTTR